MQVSAEIRWFWSDEPQAVKEWFVDGKRHPCTPGGGEDRVDLYLDDPEQVELSVKVRGKKPGVEVKGLVEVQSGLSPHGTFIGPVEVWAKWPSARLVIDPSMTVCVAKNRLLRKFDTSSGVATEIPLRQDEMPAVDQRLPEIGCNVEFTSIRIADGERAWSLGIEAFGRLDTLGRSLRSTVAVLEARMPPSLARGEMASYALWLRRRRSRSRPSS